MIKYLIGLAVLLAIALTFSVKSCKDNKKEALRQEINMLTVTLNNRQLTLKVGEYKHLEGEFKDKLDSVAKANDIKIKQIQQATIIKTVYKDTGSVKIAYRDVISKPDGSFTIPVSYDSQCWGMTGTILTKDALSLFAITEKRANNDIQLVITRDKYFLGFLWRTKKGSYRAFSDCGKVDFTDIKFIK